MKQKSQELLEDLRQMTISHIQSAEQLLKVDEADLQAAKKQDGWNVLECIEHLNLYADFYLPEIGRRIAESRHKNTALYFRSGLLGNYFAKMMLPKEKLNRMKTFKDKDPKGFSVDKSCLKRFLDHEQQMLLLLQQAAAVDLKRTKTAISISKLIKLSLGDTLRVVIYHNQRHIEQAQKLLQAV